MRFRKVLEQRRQLILEGWFLGELGVFLCVDRPEGWVISDVDEVLAILQKSVKDLLAEIAGTYSSQLPLLLLSHPLRLSRSKLDQVPIVIGSLGI